MKRLRPLRTAEWILGFLSASQNKCDLLGDSEEEFHVRLAAKGLLRADLWYVSQILFPLPFIFLSNLKWSVIMLTNYLKITLRNFRNHKAYSFINISGLAIGMACSILIVLFIRGEQSYDRYHLDLDRLYRVTMHYKGNWEVDFAYVGPAVAPLLKRDFPQVEKAARLQHLYQPLVRKKDKMFYESRGFWAENEIFEILSFKFLKGDPASALTRPFTLALSDGTAKKYFGSEEPLGKTLTIDADDYEVTAVYEDYPTNTHLKCDLMASFKTIENSDMASNWGWTNFFTYLKLTPNTDVASFREQILHLEDLYRKGGGGSDNTYFLQDVKGIHLHSRLAGEAETPGNPSTVFITATIGFIILLIACINFVNLTTARFSKRANEVGMRKVVGARGRQLVVQFLTESVLVSFVSFLTALVIAWASLPLLNEITDKGFATNDFFRSGILLAAILIILFVGLTAGGYPAFYLSLLNPISVLKGRVRAGKKGVALRKVLVVSQFAVSAFLLIGTMVVFKQIQFMKNASLGFSKEQKLVLPVKSQYLKDMDYEPFKAEFLKYPQIEDASVSSHVPGRGAGGWATILVGREEETGQPMNYWFVDFDFLGQYDIELLAGRTFEKEKASDRDSAYIINERVVQAFGLASPGDAIGQRIEVGNGLKGTIIGVAKDFHYEGMQREIRPLLMAIGPYKGTTRFNPTGLLTLSIATDRLEGTLSRVKQQWLEFHPDIPYSYYFIDDIFDMKYRSEARTQKIFFIFSCLGLFISCMGLFGLASFVVEQRTKEVGVRKVLGASVHKIVLLLSGEMAKWVLVANILAWPLAYLTMRNWLRNFAYRISMGIDIFILSGSLALIIALLTISLQTVKAALSNPVHSLRYE
jgi:putative ABC transport system permease protein